MKSQSHSLKFVLLAMVFLLMVSLACTIDIGNNGGVGDLAVQQTMTALKMTQTALEDSTADQPIQPIVEEEPDSQPISVDEPTEEVFEETPDISYEGIEFSFDSSIARDVIPATITGQNLGENSMPGETYPTHFEFNFDAYALPDHIPTPIILVYPADDYRSMSPYAGDIITQLQQALVNRPSGGWLSELPFLPMWNAAQIFTANVKYFDFQNGSGVRFLTMYGQDTYPVDNQNLFYTFQGLTADNRFYISAILPVTNAGLPEDGSTLIDDYLEFQNTWNTYITDTVNWLDGQDPANFFPDIDKLDAMMATFEINR